MKDRSLFSKFLYRYIFISDARSLSNKEKIGIFTLALFLTIIPLLYLYTLYNDWNALLLSCGIGVLYFGLYYPILFYEKLNEQYDFYSSIRFGGTYQYISKTGAYLTPGLILIILIIGFILENLLLASLIAFAFVLPFLALFFRIDVFNDDSSIEGDEIILGYNPKYYGITSLILGICGYLKVYSLLNHNFHLAIILFCITCVFQLMFLIPDKINKYLFFELRQKSGFLLYMIVLTFVFLIVSSVTSNTPIINLNNIDLSFKSIVRLIVTWGAGIGLAVLFLRKIKKMGK